MMSINGATPDIAAEVREAILVVYRDTVRPPRDTPGSALLGSDLGLDSLDLAQIIVLLERSLGVDPFRDAHAHQEIFAGLVGRRHERVGDDAVALGAHQVAPCFGVLLGNQRAAVFAIGQPAVRAGAGTRIFAIAPVEQVVAGFLAGCGVV